MVNLSHRWTHPWPFWGLEDRGGPPLFLRLTASTVVGLVEKWCTEMFGSRVSLFLFLSLSLSLSLSFSLSLSLSISLCPLRLRFRAHGLRPLYVVTSIKSTGEAKWGF